MEKGKRIAAIDGEILLPEPIIQHIQSFLSVKQAAQTSILSKSWYSAWSTRPILDFDQRDFPERSDGGAISRITDGFSEFARKTMQRYEKLNLKIDSFRLWMSSENVNYSLANELIVKAMKMSVSDLNFEFQKETLSFVLPHAVLRAENLIRFSVIGCKIDLDLDGKVNCSRLTSLNLDRVYIRSDVLCHIISSCPLIETLSLSACQCLLKIEKFLETGILNGLMWRSSFSIEFGEKNVGSAVDGAISVCKFHMLKCLFLGQVNIDNLFFRDFSSNYPCLKDLTLRYCFGFKDIRISSRSLEHISFVHDRRLRARFDVPNIRKFNFTCSHLPTLSFGSASEEWESDLSISCKYPRTSWFLRLKKLLNKLSLSRISLYLEFGFIWESFNFAGDTQGLPRTEVENLMLSASLSDCPEILDALFWSCRPKFITGHRDLLDLLSKTVVQELDENYFIPNRNIPGLRGLEEVNVECFEESLAEWQHLPWKTLLDALACSGENQKIRFKLMWGPSLVH